MKMQSIAWLVVTLCIMVITIQKVNAYTFYNYGDETVHLLVLKNENDADKMLKKLGWTGQIQGTTDKIAVYATVAQGPLAPFIMPLTGLIFGVPKLAEAIFKAKFTISDVGDIIPYSRVRESLATMRRNKIKSPEMENQISSRYKTAWNWADIKKDEKIANMFFMVMQDPESEDLGMAALEVIGSKSPGNFIEALSKKARPGDKTVTAKSLSAGIVNRSCGVIYRGQGKALELTWPFVDKKYRSKLNNDKIPNEDVKFMFLDDGIKAGKLLYTYRTGISLIEAKRIVGTNNPTEVTMEDLAEQFKEQDDNNDEEATDK